MASIYDTNSNCKECGRLVAPSSGLFGPDPSNVFCCRRCLRSFYDCQPGLWEREEDEEAYRQEQLHLLFLEQEKEEEERREQEEISRLEEEERLRRFKQKQKRNVILKYLFYLVFGYIILILLRSCH
jgi:hypothetical protein